MMSSVDKPVTAMAIDYGTRNVGIAVGQSLTASAKELPALRYGDSKESRRVLHEQIGKIIAEWKPTVVVIGWPLNMDGTESPMCAEVKQFGEMLAKETGRVISYMDERLTSHEAKSGQDEQQRNYRKRPVDSTAAKILLESWFRQNTK